MTEEQLTSQSAAPISISVAGDVISVDQVLDAIGLDCPMPLLKAKQALNKMDAGQVLFVKATDPGSVRDFKSFTDLSSHRLIKSHQEQNEYCYVIVKGE